MVIKKYKLIVIAALLLSLSCKKKKVCSKEGYEYIHTSSQCWYSPDVDSMPVGGIIRLEASVPKKFVDEYSHTTVTNNCVYIEGPLGVGMIYPTFQAAVDSFEISAQIGKVIKDTMHFSEGALKGFKTIRWDGNSPDSFKIKIDIKALAKGIYSFSLKQQGFKDENCALYKYFLTPGNSDQHLNYWAQYIQTPSEDVQRSTYCIKIY